MSNLPTPVKTPTIADVIAATTAEINAGEAPPDLLTRLRAIVTGALVPVARAIYPNFLLCTSEPPYDNGVLAVFYYFDRANRERVAARLNMTYNELMYLLAGYELGKEAGHDRLG